MSSKPSILVGIDYSPSCCNALKEASRLSNASDRPLICFHVLDEEILGSFKKYKSYDEPGIIDFARGKVEKFIEETIGTSREVHILIMVGHPFKQTLKLIEEYHVETLVLGSRGLSSNGTGQVGRLASRCLRRAPAEVLLVRNSQDHPFQVITVCVDFSENSIYAARRAAEIARQDDAKLRFIHVYRPAIYPEDETGWFGPSLPDDWETSNVESLEQRLEELGYNLGREFDIRNLNTTVLTSTRVSHEIEKYLTQINADLVVLGTRGRTGFKRLLLGTTAESIIHHTSCSALAVKPEDFH